MTIIKCAECNYDVSDKASICPHCGCPISFSLSKLQTLPASNSLPNTKNPPITVSPPVTNRQAGVGTPVVTNSLIQSQTKEYTEEKKEIFQIGRSSFVLSEIVALSEFGYRRWVAAFVAFLTLVFTFALFQGMVMDSDDSTMSDISIFFCTTTLLMGLGFAAVLLEKRKQVATTGDLKRLEGSYLPVLENYSKRVPSSRLVRYSKKDLLYSMNFVINTDRVSSFEVKTEFNFWIWLIIFCVVSSVSLMMMESAPLWGVLMFFGSGVLLLIGVLSIRSTIQIVGVGGKEVQLHTSRSDAQKLENELKSKIINLSK